MILWSDPQVQASIITTAGTVIATVVAAICAALIGKRIANAEKLKDNLDTAINDIAFLLAVEEEHCLMQRETTNQSQKMKIRKAAEIRGLNWSGKFTPGRAKHLSKAD